MKIMLLFVLLGTLMALSQERGVPAARRNRHKARPF